MTASKIEWCDRSDWNPIRGCIRVSPGCVNCYAEAIAARFSDPGQPFHGYAERTKSGPRWTGKIGLVEERLDLPLRWRKPAKIFVNSTYDLFAEGVPDEWIDRVFAVMALVPEHTFLVLTKRAQRMRDYLTADDGHRAPTGQVLFLESIRDKIIAGSANRDDYLAHHVGNHGWPVYGEAGDWPLPNVWLGVSVEDQPRADERIPLLLQTPAAKRFISAEPLLGPIDLRMLHYDGITNIDALSGQHGIAQPMRGTGPRLDQVIVGGESGPNARPMHPDWARSLRDQCVAAGVSFFMKQMAKKTPIPGDF